MQYKLLTRTYELMCQPMISFEDDPDPAMELQCILGALRADGRRRLRYERALRLLGCPRITSFHQIPDDERESTSLGGIALLGTY